MSVDISQIISYFLFGIGVVGLFGFIAYHFLNYLDELSLRKHNEKAEELYYIQENKRRIEAEERRRKEEEWDNIRPRWEEHIKYFNRLHEEQRSHLQVSFKEDKSNETMDD